MVAVSQVGLRALGDRVPGDGLRELVRSAKGGDRRAFDEIVRRTYADTYTLAFRLTGDGEDACDVVQEAYLRAFRALAGFREDSQFKTWLYRITANCAATHLGKRRHYRHELLDSDEPIEDLRVRHNPESSLDVTCERARLVRAMRELPPRLRQVIVLRDIYDLSHQAISHELGISEAAAKVRLHRARRRLRAELDEGAGLGLDALASAPTILDGALGAAQERDVPGAVAI